MEAHFWHRNKKIKHNCNFLISQFWVFYFLQFWVYILQFWLFSHNSVFKSYIVIVYVTGIKEKRLLQLFISQFWLFISCNSGFKSHNCEIKSCNYLSSLYIYIYLFHGRNSFHRDLIKNIKTAKVKLLNMKVKHMHVFCIAMYMCAHSHTHTLSRWYIDFTFRQ